MNSFCRTPAPFALITALSTLVALYAADPVPLPPWVEPVPKDAEWTIAVSPADPAATAAKDKSIVELQTLRVIKTGDIKHDTLTYSDGSTEEAWYVGKSALLTDTYVKTNIYLTEFSSYDSTGAGDPVHSLGFTGVGWLSPQAYVDTVTYQNVSCYHYRFPHNPSVEAWVSVKDKMPVAYQISGKLYVYTFGPAPVAQLTLPPAYQAVWDQNLLTQKRREMYQKDLGIH